ncbi:hypothetical protein BDC45DRAFT_528593, partial [Circinella umbellata]
MLFISCPLMHDPLFIHTSSYGIHFFLLMPLFMSSYPHSFLYMHPLIILIFLYIFLN